MYLAKIGGKPAKLYNSLEVNNDDEIKWSVKIDKSLLGQKLNEFIECVGKFGKWIEDKNSEIVLRASKINFTKYNVEIFGEFNRPLNNDEILIVQERSNVFIQDIGVGIFIGKIEEKKSYYHNYVKSRVKVRDYDPDESNFWYGESHFS